MDRSLREFVRMRAGNACEYCRMPQQETPLFAFHIEHIVSKQHGGTDDTDGLALACDRCNAYKGPNLTSIDPETRAVVALFNPRLDAWGDHFVIRGGLVIGLTAIGSATVRLLNMNAPRRVELRREWLQFGGGSFVVIFRDRGSRDLTHSKISMLESACTHYLSAASVRAISTHSFTLSHDDQPYDLLSMAITFFATSMPIFMTSRFTDGRYLTSIKIVSFPSIGIS